MTQHIFTGETWFYMFSGMGNHTVIFINGYLVAMVTILGKIVENWSNFAFFCKIRCYGNKIGF